MFSSLESRVLDAIHEEEIVRLTQELIRIPTVGRDEQAIAEHVAGRMRGWGFPEVLVQGIEGHPGRANLVATIPGRSRRPRLLTTAHMDTAPVDLADRATWVCDPFAGEIRDGHVFGRGAHDDKAGCAIVTLAAKAILDAGVTLPGDLVVALVADEEGLMLGMRQLIRSGLHRTIDACIGADPFDGQALFESFGGRTYGVVTVKGRTAHASMPPWSHEGVNAVTKAAKLINALDRHQPSYPEHPLWGRPYWQVLRVESGWGGTLTAQLPDRCRLLVDARLVPDQDPETVWVELRAVLAKLQSDDPDFAWELEVPDHRPGYHTKLDDPVVMAVSAAYHQLTGLHLKVREPGESGPLTIGTTDTHYLAYEGIPCVNLPGPVAETQPVNAHLANENVTIATLVASTRCLALAILRYFNVR